MAIKSLENILNDEEVATVVRLQDINGDEYKLNFDYEGLIGKEFPLHREDDSKPWNMKSEALITKLREWDKIDYTAALQKNKDKVLPY